MTQPEAVLGEIRLKSCADVFRDRFNVPENVCHNGGISARLTDRQVYDTLSRVGNRSSV